MAVDEILAFESPYIRRNRRAGARCRLLCFPHIGAGASDFNHWSALLPPEVEVVGMQLPGRQDRIKDKPFTEIGPLVRTLTHVVRPLLDLPIALFGHSGGALLAFELACTLAQRQEADIIGVFPSGQGAPHLPLPAPIHNLPAVAFRQELARLGGIAGQVASDARLMAYLEPTLRADFRLWESYRYRPRPPLDAAVIACGGADDDRTPVAALKAWNQHTTGSFALQVFPAAISSTTTMSPNWSA